MVKNHKQVIEKFQAGQFNEVVEGIENVSALKANKELLPLWIGSLVFTGDVPKAEALFNKSKASDEELIASRFFLAVGMVRQSRYAEARTLIAQNTRAKNKTSESLFYIYQGLAFYRFFCGRFYLSKKYAQKAFQSAVESEFTFGEMISKDLLAHSLVQTGQVRKGLNYFEEALKTATRAKNQWLSAAIKISVLKFRAQFGLDPSTDLSDLEEALGKLAPQDTYSVAELLLELTRQYLLRGQFTKAENCLSRASDIIYKHQNRRQVAMLNLRMVYMLYLQAQYTQALHVIRFAEQNIDREVDLNLWMQMTGLKTMILRSSNHSAEAEEIQRSLRAQSERVQTAINQKIIARSQPQEGRSAFPTGEDPIGDLLDKARAQDPTAPQLIVQSGYYGLLHKYYRVPFGTQCLIFDLIPGSVVILDKGNVTFKKKGLNSLLRKIILLLKNSPQSKEDLVRQIWGYEYDPLRHDTLIYSSINKVRKLLEPYGEWISLSEQGYFIRKDIKVIIKNALKTSNVRAVKIQPQLVAERPKAKVVRAMPVVFKDLNFRQLQIIDYLKKNISISILELSTKLEISKPTATRDLSQLHKLGILKRVGKGRATRYLI